MGKTGTPGRGWPKAAVRCLSKSFSIFRRKARQLHCPLNAPLAVWAVSKAGSLSVARWIAQIDLARARDFALMASTWTPLNKSRKQYLDWASRWVMSPRAERQEGQESEQMAMRSRFGDESTGVVLAASASSCLLLGSMAFRSDVPLSNLFGAICCQGRAAYMVLGASRSFSCGILTSAWSRPTVRCFWRLGLLRR